MIGRTMQAHAYDLAGLTAGSKLSIDVAVDLALSAESSVMWSVNFTDNTVRWISGLENVLGAPGADEERLQEKLRSLLQPLIVAAASAPILQYFELEQPCELPNGTTKWVRFRARTFGESETEGVVGVASDATDRYESQQALADLADRYRLLVELSPDAICVHEAGLVVYVNPATVTFLGAKSARDIVGKPISTFVDPSSIPDLHRRVAALNKPGATSTPTEVLLRRIDGGQMSIESVSVRTTWEGRPAYQVIMRDITAQKAGEAALRYRAALVEHVSDAIISTDKNGIVTSWNPAAAMVYQHATQYAIGRPVSELVGSLLDPAAILRLGGVMEATHRRHDGSALAIRVSAAEMDDGYVLVCADETARRRAEQRFSTVVAALDEGVIVFGESGKIESANPAAQHILGLSHKQLIGSDLSHLPLSDESGMPVPSHAYPAAHTRRTGQSQTGRVLRVERHDHREVWISLTSRVLNQQDNAPASVIMSFTDITERRAIAARLAHEATHDPLTNLANRNLIIDELDNALRNQGNGGFSVLFIDLDKFKVINDSLGHSVGDQVLRVASRRLYSNIGPQDSVGRLGGDEFVVVLRNLTDSDKIAAFAKRLRSSLAEPIAVGERQLHIDSSIGIVVSEPQESRRAEDLIRDADVAMYQAKMRGRGRLEFFDVALRERMQHRHQLEQDLREAIPNNQFWIAYQPVVEIQSGRTVGVESLVRWNHPAQGPISPNEFIPLAEESDLINLIGSYTLHQTTQEIAARYRGQPLDLLLKVNVSTRQLDNPDLVSMVRGALASSGLPAKSLCLEITESALMRDSEAAIDILDSLHDLGVGLAIDDFGTGYSSLALLQRLTLDILKIDRSFITDLETNDGAVSIVKNIILMAHAVHLTVIAEGVENQQQLDILRDLGCDQAQGFYLGRPVTADTLFPRLVSNT